MGGTDMFGRTVVNTPGGFSVVIGNGPLMVGLGVQLASSLLQNLISARQQSAAAQEVDPSRAEVGLECTLEELYRGCEKVVEASEDVPDALLVKVQPGWKAGTKITFVGEHESRPNGWEVCVTIREAPHHFFTREGNDLVYRAVASKSEVESDATLSIPGFADADAFPFQLRGKPTGGDVTRWRLTGKGMPSSGNKLRGDMVVELQVLPDLAARCERIAMPARRMLGLWARQARIRLRAVLALVWAGFKEGVKVIGGAIHKKVLLPASRHPLWPPVKSMLEKALAPSLTFLFLLVVNPLYAMLFLLLFVVRAFNAGGVASAFSS